MEEHVSTYIILHKFDIFVNIFLFESFDLILLSKHYTRGRFIRTFFYGCGFLVKIKIDNLDKFQSYLNSLIGD